MFEQRWKVEVALLFVNGVAFPAEVAKFHVRELCREQRLQMAGVLGRGNVCPADERHDIASLRRESSCRSGGGRIGDPGFVEADVFD